MCVLYTTASLEDPIGLSGQTLKRTRGGMGRMKSVSAVWEAVMDFQLAHFVLQAVRDGRHEVFEADDSKDRNVISLT